MMTVSRTEQVPVVIACRGMLLVRIVVVVAVRILPSSRSAAPGQPDAIRTDIGCTGRVRRFLAVALRWREQRHRAGMRRQSNSGGAKNDTEDSEGGQGEYLHGRSPLLTRGGMPR